MELDPVNEQNQIMSKRNEKKCWNRLFVDSLCTLARKILL